MKHDVLEESNGHQLMFWHSLQPLGYLSEPNNKKFNKTLFYIVSYAFHIEIVPMPSFLTAY